MDRLATAGFNALRVREIQRQRGTKDSSSGLLKKMTNACVDNILGNCASRYYTGWTRDSRDNPRRRDPCQARPFVAPTARDNFRYDL